MRVRARVYMRVWPDYREKEGEERNVQESLEIQRKIKKLREALKVCKD